MLKCVDAKVGRLIHVGMSAIKLAKRRSHGCCALSEGLSQEDDVEWCEVSKTRAFIKYKNDDFVTRYQINGRTRDMLIAYDKGAQFEPGSYSIAAIPISETADEKRKCKRGTGNKHPWKQMPLTGVRGLYRAFKTAP